MKFVTQIRNVKYVVSVQSFASQLYIQNTLECETHNQIEKQFTYITLTLLTILVKPVVVKSPESYITHLSTGHTIYS